MDEYRLGARLRAERERRKITLEHVAETTKISIGLLRDLERDHLARWPTGIFRRSFVRAYAHAIGLDPDETLDEFLQCYPDPPRQGPFEDSPLANQSSAAAMARLARPDRLPHSKPAFRLTLADHPQPFSGGALLARFPRRLAAAGWDALTAIGLAGFVYLWLDRFWIPLAVIMVSYHAGSVLVLGNTPGVYFFAPSIKHDDQEPPPEDDELGDLSSSSIFHPRGV